MTNDTMSSTQEKKERASMFRLIWIGMMIVGSAFTIEILLERTIITVLDFIGWFGLFAGGITVGIGYGYHKRLRTEVKLDRSGISPDIQDIKKEFEY